MRTSASRRSAAPRRLPIDCATSGMVDVAVGLVAARMGVTTDDALGMLRRAAETSGVSEVQAAAVARGLLA